MANALTIFYSPSLHSRVRMEWEPLDEMKDIVQEGWGWYLSFPIANSRNAAPGKSGY